MSPVAVGELYISCRLSSVVVDSLLVGALSRQLGTSHDYRRQAATVPTTSYNNATTNLRLRKTEISVADGCLKVLNISKLKGDRRQAPTNQATTEDHALPC